MGNRSHLAGWAALVVSVVTLVLVASLALRPEPAATVRINSQLTTLSGAVQSVTDDVARLRDAIEGPGTGLRSVIATTGESLATGIREAPDDVEAQVADVLNLVETIEARLSDICFKLEAC